MNFPFDVKKVLSFPEKKLKNGFKNFFRFEKDMFTKTKDEKYYISTKYLDPFYEKGISKNYFNYQNKKNGHLKIIEIRKDIKPTSLFKLSSGHFVVIYPDYYLNIYIYEENEENEEYDMFGSSGKCIFYDVEHSLLIESLSVKIIHPDGSTSNALHSDIRYLGYFFTLERYFEIAHV